MKTISEIRRNNAKTLAAKCDGNQAFSARIDRESTQVSRFIGKNPTKNIGDALARHIEECFNLPIGWMDNDHNKTSEEIREEGASYNVDPFPLVPIYTIKDLDNDRNGSGQRIRCPFPASNDSFALLIEGIPGTANPMHPQYGKAYPVGSIVFADRRQAADCENGDLVIAELINREPKVTAFRQLYEEAGSQALMPLNPQFPATTEPFKVVARVVGAILP